MSKNRPNETPELIRISATTLGDMLLTSCDRSPDKLAVRFPEGSATYFQLSERAMGVARGLIALGVKPRAHVGILLTSGIPFVEVLFGVALCGAVAVLMNTRYKPVELAYVAENADLAVIVTSDEMSEHVDFVSRLQQAFADLGDGPGPLDIPQAPKLRHIVLLGSREAPGFTDQRVFDTVAADVDSATLHRARLGVRIRDICLILYTSGTSANPKGCLLTHESVTREASNLGCNRWQFDDTDRVWSPLPLFHIAALSAMLSVFDVGGTFYGLPHFDAGASLRQIEANRVTMLFLPFVTFHQALIGHPHFAQTDMEAIQLMNSCFATMPDAVGQAYRSKVPHTLQCGTFGMTEATGIVCTGGYAMDPELGFTRLGFPLAGIEVRIVDPSTGADLPTGVHGEVLIRGYSIFDGYYRDPDKTARALDADLWFHSGDVGSLDGNGHIMFHGRANDILKVGGENVSAAEVEAVLQRYPGVRLAQVMGVPDPRLAEIPVAYVDRDGTAEVTADALIGYARSQLASFKVPRHIRFIEEWPMSASKIQKFKLRRALMDELGIVD